MQSYSRRNFLLHSAKSLLAASALTGSASVLTSCATAPVRPKGADIEKLLLDGARVMWVAAHPDDETMVGSILLRSSLMYRNPLYMLVLTEGEGGECCRQEGCLPDLRTVRQKEMKIAAELYRAELQHESYFNASLPVESFPSRPELARIWQRKKDPTIVIAQAIRKFRPDLIFTFCPHNGFTGHPEHQVASRFTTAGVRLAADASATLDGTPAHRVSHVYYGLNKYWPFKLLGRTDPLPVTETWDATLEARNGWECRHVMARFSKAHRSQDRDMSTIRALVGMLDEVYLHRTDPFSVILDPYEPVA